LVTREGVCRTATGEEYLWKTFQILMFLSPVANISLNTGCQHRELTLAEVAAIISSKGIFK